MRPVPPWLEPLLAASFFSPCATHGDATRGECNMFCLDCPGAGAFCSNCRSARHADHRTIQIRRSSYHDVVRVSEVQRALDVGGVQTYVINSARVVFLNERPLPKAGAAAAASGSGGGAATKCAAHTCEACGRALLDPFRFCSLGCKLESIKNGEDACLALGGGEESVVVEGEAAAAASPGGGKRAGSARTEEEESLQLGAARDMQCPPPAPELSSGLAAGRAFPIAPHTELLARRLVQLLPVVTTCKLLSDDLTNTPVEVR